MAELKPISKDTRQNGNSPCNIQHSKTCKHIRATDTFQSTMTGQSYKVRTAATYARPGTLCIWSCAESTASSTLERQGTPYTSVSMATGQMLRPGRWRNQWLPTLTFRDTPWETLWSWSLRRYGEKYTAERRRESYWIHHFISMTPEGMNLEDWPANTATDAWRTPPSVDCINDNCL